MANYSAYIPAAGSTTYPTQISNFITISEGMDTEIEVGRDGLANLLANFNTKLPLAGGTMTGALTISTGSLTISTGGILIGASSVPVKDGALSNGVVVTGDASGRISTTSGIVAANIVERSGTLVSGDVAVATTGNDIQTTGLVATNITTLSGSQTITGDKTFSGTNTISGDNTFTAIPAFNGGTTGASAPFTVDSTDVVLNLNADLLDGTEGNLFALLASPTFSGTPSLPTGTTAVTQTAGDNDTSIATTAFVSNFFSSGTWTPIFTDTTHSSSEGQSYTQQIGTYYKIGDLVYITFVITLSSIGTLTSGDQCFIESLPFTPGIGSYSSTIAFNECNNLAITSGTTVTGLITSGAYLRLYVWDSTTGTSVLTVGDVTASVSLRGSGFYHVT